MWNVHWLNPRNGHSGKSIEPMPKEDADAMVKSLKRDNDGLDYWVQRDEKKVKP